MDNLTLIGLILVLLLALSWHEAAHAWVADRLGDPTARQLGRVTLNPLKHLDPFLSVLLPIVMLMTVGVAFGGGKPVPINPAYFRHKSRDFMLVALAGPGSNLVLAALFALLFVVGAWTGLLDGGGAAPIRNPYGADVVYAPSLLRSMEGVLRGATDQPLAESWLSMGVLLNLLLALFNLTPLPPLDGSRVVGWLLPGRQLKEAWYRLDRFGLFLVLGFYFLLDGFRYLQPILLSALDWTGNLTDDLISLGASP